MKIKDLHYDLAKAMCERRLKKFDYGEHTCDECPLRIENSPICWLRILYYIKEYGDKEIKYEKED
jgi:hypothetical protein